MEQSLIDAITQMREGKEEGFNAVYAATYDHLYARAKQLVRDEEEADDVVQAVYMEAYKNAASLSSPDTFLSWLDTLTYNQALKITHQNK